jgi:predicted adenylyl cyclase CyaB
MPENVEIKARANDPDALAVRVERLSDTPCAESLQEDTFFPTARGRLKLRVTGPGDACLIYYEREDSLGPKPSRYLLAPAPEPETLKALLAACLGVRGVVRKQRRLYMIGNTRVHLDRVEGLGAFVELEVMLVGGQSPDEGLAVARDIMAKLGISDRDLVKGAYIDLVEAAGRRQAIL